MFEYCGYVIEDLRFLSILFIVLVIGLFVFFMLVS